MLKIKNQFKIISIYLFMFIGLLFINMNQVMASPKKEDRGKNVATSKEKETLTKEEVKRFFEYHKTFETYSDEDKIKIIEKITDPEVSKLLDEYNEKKRKSSKEESSSSKKPDNSKK
ncbi:effector, AYWB SAP11-like protein [Maize bushy stunt phytoplasma]|uniref:Effector, AYWB SAP11-like protein n=1 Tax=Maize bushy stunt phytoplasma TaxID=202462 RepID=A0ABM6DLD7_9MOLU|nr:SVM family protein [Maize bushy stunt phytoplasma]AOF54642.1 effector, AYWB SAP11-like protein [Maize bushy stunt phytoplasma]